MNVSLIGGGVMGEVFLSAGIRSGLFDVEQTIVCDIRPERCEELAKKVISKRPLLHQSWLF